MKRIDCIRVLGEMAKDVLVVTTAGGATHEWWALGDNRGQLPARTLGLCSSIGLGLAIALPHRRVLVLDGDGGLLMNLNTLVTTAVHKPANLIHICFDNGVYESSGGTPTFTGAGVNLAAIATAAGIAATYDVSTPQAFAAAVTETLDQRRHTFILVRVEPGLGDVPPIPIDEVENKYRFAHYIESLEGRKILAGPTSPIAKAAGPGNAR
ncbi:MAG: sulfopyruvate decarboxylase subunit beta [Chloroflexota bacterium]|nr:sulfopyruvate decarboxylase subunit beta [Chloroflexota bacterium]